MYKISSLIFVILFCACSMHKRQIESYTVSNFGNYNEKRFKVSVDYYQYLPSLEISKTIYYNLDHTLNGLDFNFRTIDESKSFYISWDKRDVSFKIPNADTSTLAKNVRSRNLDPFYVNEKNVKKIDNLYLSHFGINAKNESIYISIEDKPYESSVEISYENDSIAYDRELELSEDVIDYYKNLIVLFGDSIELVQFPKIPNLSTCVKVKYSSHRKTTCISKAQGYFKETEIDSTLTESGYDIKETEYLYYYFEKIDENGTKIVNFSNENFGFEKHYDPSDLINPIYAFQYRLKSVGKDTLYKIEEKNYKKDNLYCTKYQIIDNLEYYRNDQDLRLPIKKREIHYWRNKSGKVVRIQHIAHTNQGDRLETDKVFDKGKWRLVVDERKIPHVSDELIYDLSFPYIYHINYYQGYQRKSKVKNKYIPYYKDVRRTHNKQLIKLEHNRTLNYGKWISKDSSRLIEVKYI